MEFKEIVLDILKNKEYQGDITDLRISSYDLIPYHYYLTKCDMFKGCNLDLSANTLKVDDMHTFKLSNETKFVGDFILDYITFTPQLFVGSVLTVRPDNDAIISPTLYDLETFTPYRYIKIWLTPEHGGDISDKVIKNNLMDRFEKILNNPEEYASVKTHGLLLRGKFKTSITDTTITHTALTIEHT